MRSNNEVLLVLPPALIKEGGAAVVFPPIGLAYLASSLKEHLPEVGVGILDAVAEGYPHSFPWGEGYRIVGLSDELFQARVAEVRPAVVGFSCLFTNQHEAVLRAARLVKEIDPTIRVVVGGAHATAVPEELLQHPEIDLVVRGPGELTFVELLRCWLDNGDIRKIPSIAFRDPDTNVAVVRPIRIPEIPLDDYPFPDYSALNMPLYWKWEKAMPIHPTHQRAFPIVTARGCPHKCVFCYVPQAWGKSMFHRSIDNVRAEIRHLREHWGCEELQVLDDNFGHYMDFTLEFLDVAKAEGIRKIMPFNGATLLSTRQPLFLDKMQELGLEYLRIFTESGEPETLKKMRKPHNRKMIDEVITAARRRNLMLYAYFIMGFPWQSIEDMEREAKTAREFDVDFSTFFVVTALPGTKLHEECKSQGILAPDVAYSDINNYSGNLTTSRFSHWDVERVTKQAYIDANFSDPERIPRIARLFNQPVEEIHRRKTRAEEFLAKVIARQADKA